MIRFVKNLALLALLCSISALASPIYAQVPSVPPPYNSPVPAPPATTPTAVPLITNTQQAAGVVDSNIINNLAYKGVHCTVNQVTESGSPENVISIMVYDTASATFQTWASAPGIKTLVPGSQLRASVMVYPGVSETSAVAELNVQALKLPRFFKVRQTITGTNTWVTGTVGCDLLN